jgi:hypothetical protein
MLLLLLLSPCQRCASQPHSCGCLLHFGGGGKKYDQYGLKFALPTDNMFYGWPSGGDTALATVESIGLYVRSLRGAQ